MNLINQLKLSNQIVIISSLDIKNYILTNISLLLYIE